jgi:hypothetical protein
VADEQVRSGVSTDAAAAGCRVASPTPEGGFRLGRDDGHTVEARPDTGGWIVSSTSRDDEWFLREISSPYRGYTLEERRTADALGQISRLETAAGTPGLVSVVLGDGRLFTISPRVGDPPGYDLSGWEVSGAYWSARLEGGRWSLSPTPAGTMLPDAETLVVLFAAELLLTS